MNHSATGPSHELACEVCGRLPEPPKARLTVANIAAMLPIELVVHAVVVESHLPYVLKVLVLTLTATVLVIWVAEPSAARILQRWLHAPALKKRRRLHSSASLWRARVVLRDEPGALESVTHELARHDVNILSIHVHQLSGAVMDELVLSAPAELSERKILQYLSEGGGTGPALWPTTALALADGQTMALSLAIRVSERPAELGLAVAELLRAKLGLPDGERYPGEEACVMKLPTAFGPPLVLSRPGEPFTPAESARAHRLAELAERTELATLN
ncbi:amino acid-binding protein [Pseudarthrobacter sp. J1738]|uniref:amino acid-binding protein n=1 Tax=Pseudarthrobacter sp. J1738 TaxID=3420446 RepID=UPI003D2D8C1A